ncbi:MAG: hypothetical protein LIO80_01810 [Lachnospiraceae bacterium]|nr:hypothetical protein [Lachnospiraceae bacterium]
MKRRMKKLLALSVVASMTASICFVSYASEVTGETNTVNAMACDTDDADAALEAYNEEDSGDTLVSAGDTLVVRRGNVYYFSYSIKSGAADLVITYGQDADEVLIGDWDGDGVDTLCVRRDNAYYFSNSLTDGAADFVIYYGKSTDEVLVGDWDGDGVDTLTVRRGNTCYISNSLKSGNADQVIDYGRSTDEVLAGDWDGDGADTLTVRRGNSYYISNSLKSGAADQVIDYGRSTDTVLVGDWDADGKDTLCVRRGNSYYFSDSLKNGAADQVVAYGRSTDDVYAGTWQTSAGLNTYSGVLGSWSSGGEEDYQYTAAIFVYEDDYTTYSNPSLVESGTYDADSAANVVINDTTSGDNGIILYNVGTYSIANASIVLDTEADGTDTCDFSGRGSAVAVYGDSVVTITDSYIETTGVATMPVFADSGSTVTIDDSTLVSNGGTLYGDYMNTPDQALMVAPPWILGIMGTSRCTNLMGNDSTMNVTDSDTQAGAWAVLSTDSGSNMYLNIYDTSLTLNNADESAAAPLQQTTHSDGTASQLYETKDNPYTTNYGSGYGTYVIGSAVETFAGATVNVGTYASIFTGGSAVYTSIEAGETYTLSSATGENDIEYTAEETKVTEINSDTFGFMVHQSANYITIEEGTVVNSGYATFLVKSGSSNESVDATVDDAEISNGGVLIQVMDNDDATNGGMMTTEDEQNYNGSGMNFRTVHTEDAGFSTDEAANGGSEQNFTFTNGDYTGNVYNASGSDQSTEGSLDASTLNLTLGAGATLTGAVASTSAIHVTYAGSQIVLANGGDAYDTVEDAAEVLAEQNTSFDATEYYSIGQVANLVNYNGGNDINVTLTDDAVWTVDGTSVITSLSISDSATVVVAEGVTLTVDGVVYGAGTYDANAF